MTTYIRQNALKCVKFAISQPQKCKSSPDSVAVHHFSPFLLFAMADMDAQTNVSSTLTRQAG
jgi:hypothetical protein